MFIIQQYQSGDWTISDTNTGYSRPLNSPEIAKVKLEFPFLAREVTTSIFCIDRMQSIKVHNSQSMKRHFPKNIPGYRKPLTNESPRIKKIFENSEISRVGTASSELSPISRLRFNAYKRLLRMAVLSLLC